MAPVCASCGLTMERGSGVLVVEMFRQPPEPYKLWLADAFKCLGCGTEIVADFAANPVAEHFEAKFKELHDSLSKYRRVIKWWEKKP